MHPDPQHPLHPDTHMHTHTQSPKAHLSSTGCLSSTPCPSLLPLPVYLLNQRLWLASHLPLLSPCLFLFPGLSGDTCLATARLSWKRLWEEPAQQRGRGLCLASGDSHQRRGPPRSGCQSLVTSLQEI